MKNGNTLVQITPDLLGDHKQSHPLCLILPPAEQEELWDLCLTLLWQGDSASHSLGRGSLETSTQHWSMHTHTSVQLPLTWL